MILFVTPSQRGPECSAAIESATQQPTQVAKSFQEAMTSLRTSHFSAVIVDENLLDADPDQGSLVLQHIETAVPIYVNCAVHGTQRIVHKVHAALQLRARDEASARKSALANLRCELREPLTGIILNCELALSSNNEQSDLKEKILSISTLAHQLSAKLQLDEVKASFPN